MDSRDTSRDREPAAAGYFTFLPSPIKDETLPSLLARQGRLLWCGTHTPLIEAVFGRSARNVRSLMPAPVTQLAEALGVASPQAGGDGMILRWTAAAYFAPFMAAADHAALLETLRTGWKHGGYTGMGLFRDRWSHRTLNFCPECLTADLDEEGLPGWRRVHQLPGVYACPEHRCALMGSPVPTAGSESFPVCPDRCGPARELRPPFDLAAAIRIAVSSRWLLENPLPPQPPSAVQAVFRNLMSRGGHLAPNGSAVGTIRRDVVAWLGCSEDSFAPEVLFGRHSRSARYLWGRSGKAGPPTVAALLLMDYLRVTPAEFFELCSAGRPATSGRRGGPGKVIRPWTIPRHRKTIRSTLAQSQGASRTVIRKLVPAAYCFLLEHDRDWLESVLPPARRARFVLNWPKRDRELSRRALASIEALRRAPGQPRRLTFAGIVSSMDLRTSLYRRDERLPLTLAVIDAAVEDQPSVMRRRAEWGLGAGWVSGTETWSSFAATAGFKENHAGPETSRWAKAAFDRKSQTTGYRPIRPEQSDSATGPMPITPGVPL